MQKLFLTYPDFPPFDKSQIETLLRTGGFHNVRTDLLIGSLLEAEFGDGDH